MDAVPRTLDQHVSVEKVLTTTHQAREELRESCADLLPTGWPNTASEETIQAFIDWFKDRVKREPSAGNASLLFARAVLSTFRSDRHLTDMQKKALEGLCLAINERPFPAMLWADFVRKYLDSPAIISRVLTGCVRNTAHLELQIQKIMKQHHQRLNLTEGGVVVVFGYSGTIVAALRGLPPEVSKTLKILTPRQSLPERELPDGELLQKAIGKSVEVMDNEDALNRLRGGEPRLLLMGCKVIGLRETGKLEIVNSYNAYHYAEAAFKVRIPIGIITGTYKLWPIQIYENHRPMIVSEKSNDHPRNSIVEGKLITWVMTEDGVFPQKKFSNEYKTYFTIEGVPVASVRGCVSGEEFKPLRVVTSQINTIVGALGIPITTSIPKDSWLVQLLIKPIIIAADKKFKFREYAAHAMSAAITAIKDIAQHLPMAILFVVFLAAVLWVVNSEAARALLLQIPDPSVGVKTAMLVIPLVVFWAGAWWGANNETVKGMAWSTFIAIISPPLLLYLATLGTMVMSHNARIAVLEARLDESLRSFREEIVDFRRQTEAFTEQTAAFRDTSREITDKLDRMLEELRKR